MKVEAIKCPSCGAHININKNDQIVKCEYCDTTLSVKDKNENDNIVEENNNIFDEEQIEKTFDKMREIVTKESKKMRKNMGMNIFTKVIIFIIAIQIIVFLISFFTISKSMLNFNL